MSVRRSLVVLAVFMFAVPALVFAARARQLQNAKPDQNLQFYAVAQSRVDVAVTAIGSVEAEAVASLSFMGSGRVAEVLVEAGDAVAAGDVLARLVSDNEQIALARAQLGLQLAELQKEDLIQPPDAGDIAIAQANVTSAWGAYLGLQNAVSPEDIQAAELRYLQALDQVEDARQTRARARLGQPDEVYAILDSQIGQAAFNAEIERLQLESLKNGNQGQLNASYARAVQAERELEQAQAGATQAQIDQADIAIAQAQADVDRAQQTLNQMAMIAPFDGVISEVNIEAGGLGTPGLPALELTDISPLHVTVQVDEIDIRQIREGMEAIVELDALPDLQLSATIEHIALVGTNEDGIISYDVRVRLDSSDSRVRVGMTAEASVIIEQRMDVLTVPNAYIRLDRDQNRAYVNIVGGDGQLQEVEVVLGLQGQDSSEIVSGLDAGDVLVVDLGGDRLSFLGG
ncbi:MAG: efflux RND transporter periplasmic adaptor subunit [Anaerolineae bacterium]|nr:efflux RND transporter periplasmic adaptor subunit [Anaerolineae bacterium]